MKTTSRKAKGPTCEHKWVVFSTCGGEEPCLLVQCAECYAVGGVFETTIDEWNKAYYAPSQPYPWHDGTRVRVLAHEQKPYVIKKAPRRATKRLSEDDIIAAFHEYLELGRPDSVEVNGNRHESQHVCKVLRRCDLCLPDKYCKMLKIPIYSMYGEAVKHLAAVG